MYIVGKISDHSKIYSSGTYGSTEPNDATIASSMGINLSEHSIFRLSDTSNDCKRIQTGDAFNLVWEVKTITTSVPVSTFVPNPLVNGEYAGSTETITYTDVTTQADFITGVDFTPEDTKLWIHGSSDKPSILANGIDEATLKLELLLPDKSAVDTTANVTLDIPIMSSLGPIKIRFEVVNGVGTRAIKTPTPGSWTGPTSKVDGYRIDTKVYFDAVL
jgi:hypothetical protein